MKADTMIMNKELSWANMTWLNVSLKMSSIASSKNATWIANMLNK